MYIHAIHSTRNKKSIVMEILVNEFIETCKIQKETFEEANVNTINLYRNTLYEYITKINKKSSTYTIDELNKVLSCQINIKEILKDSSIDTINNSIIKILKNDIDIDTKICCCIVYTEIIRYSIITKNDITLPYIPEIIIQQLIENISLYVTKTTSSPGLIHIISSIEFLLTYQHINLSKYSNTINYLIIIKKIFYSHSFVWYLRSSILRLFYLPFGIFWPITCYNLDDTYKLHDTYIQQEDIVWMIESIIDMFVGEKDPWNLLLLFPLIYILIKELKNHENYIKILEKCFTTISCYFPITILNTISLPKKVLKKSLTLSLLSSKVCIIIYMYMFVGIYMYIIQQIYAKPCAALISQCLRDIEEETRLDSCELLKELCNIWINTIDINEIFNINIKNTNKYVKSFEQGTSIKDLWNNLVINVSNVTPSSPIESSTTIIQIKNTQSYRQYVYKTMICFIRSIYNNTNSIIETSDTVIIKDSYTILSSTIQECIRELESGSEILSRTTFTDILINVILRSNWDIVVYSLNIITHTIIFQYVLLYYIYMYMYNIYIYIFFTGRRTVQYQINRQYRIQLLV